jgi:hypothetical protein
MLKRITPDELKEYLRKHKLWVCGEDGGERADLCYANLSCANLSYADLRGANLRGADLRGADLRGAKLSCADLCYANLSCANLSYADLRGANLRGADLRGADLRGAKLSCADLRDAKLRGADLRDVKYNELTAFYALACPESGAFIGWKTACGKIVKLEICEDAKRSSATSRKCRCSKAKVLAIENMDGGDSGLSAISSDHNSSFVYTVGETVEVSDYDNNRWNECSAGIHFFITRDEAVRWGQ